MAAVRTVNLSSYRSNIISDDIKVELDSHADTSVVGRHCHIIHHHRQVVNVVGYDKVNGSREAPIVDAAFLYTDAYTLKRYILRVNQAIHIDTMDNNLLCPMQCRLNGVTVNEIPKFLVDNPTNVTHSLVFPMQEQDDDAHPTIIPLALDGVTSYFLVTKPTQEDVEDESMLHLDLTAENPPWNPQDPDFAHRERNMVDSAGLINIPDTTARGPVFISEVSLNNDAVDVSGDTDLFAQALNDNVAVTIAYLGTKDRKPDTNHIELANRWGISPDKALRTTRVTTQRGVRHVTNPTLTRRFRSNDRQRRYNRIPHVMFSDTAFSKVKSSRGNTMSQVFATDFGWSRNYPMRQKSQAHEALSVLFSREGVPNAIVTDDAKEMQKGKFAQKCRDADTDLRQLEPFTPWANAAEREIKELKRGAGRKLVSSKCPKRFWDYCLEFESYIRSHTAHDIFKLDGRVPEALVSGETPDISEYCDFAWYQWVMYRHGGNAKFPEEPFRLGRYLGPSIGVGPAQTARILIANGEVLDRSTFRSLTPAEIENEELSHERKAFRKSVEARWGPKATEADLEVDDLGLLPTPTNHSYFDDLQSADTFPDLKEELPEIPTPEAEDTYVNAEIMLPRGDGFARGRVVKRKRGIDGEVIGRANTNPILDTRLYEVQFPGGEVTELTANVIAQSMYAQCDADGNEYLLLESFVDYRKESGALTMDEQEIVVRGRKSLRRSTKGWKICCQWKDNSTSWEKLSDLKESHPVQVAEYAVAQGIAHEPAFNWWVTHVLRKRDRIVAAVKKRNVRYLKKTHKFGIELPKSVAEAYELDRRNGDTKWADAIAKEMKNVRVAFRILPNGERVPQNYQFVHCHMIFDVKMEDLRRKARLVAGGHTTEAPATMTYASVVSRETVRIALLIAALNDLPVWAADIMNAYVTAPNQEKIWTTLGPEFGEDAGKKAIIVRALYGLKSAGASFRHHLADCMKHLGYTPCLADPDLWMKPEVRPDDGVAYYAYILCYVDDILSIAHNAEDVLRRLDKYFMLKPGSLGDPDIYLGAKLKKMKLSNGVEAWAMSPAQCMEQSVKNVEKYLEENLSARWKLPSKAENPFAIGYSPELDDSPELDPSLSSYYQSQIGTLRWMVELGRIDMMTEVSMLASHLAMPREGHLEAIFHIYAYLKQKYNSRLAFDPTYPCIDMSDFKECDWKQFYGDVTEAIPPNAPEPRGKDVDLRMFVDSDHAGDKLTRRSRTGFMIFMNTALIDALSKKQATIETSVFGAEFVALKHGIERLRGLRYKLRMMGVSISGPSYIYGDNMSVIHNTQRPESTLKKKSHSLCYHAARESVAMGESLTGHIATDKNVADLLTKVLYGQKRKRIVGEILYDIYDDF